MKAAEHPLLSACRDCRMVPGRPMLRAAMNSTPEGTLRTAADLVEHGLIDESARDAVAAVSQRYAIAIPAALARLLEQGDPADPLGRQFVPDPAELLTTPEELKDPIGDAAHAPCKGIVHRYPDRVLLKPL